MDNVSLMAVEGATMKYAGAYGLLRLRVEALQAQVNEATRRAMPGIKSALQEAAAAKHELRGLVDQGGREGLFERPRTVVFHGVKVGIVKGKGKIEFDDEAQVIRLIRKQLPEQVDGLVVVKETVARAALKNLAVGDLKRIGCRVTDTDDQVVIAMVDGEFEKVVTALLADAETVAAEGN